MCASASDSSKWASGSWAPSGTPTASTNSRVRSDGGAVSRDTTHVTAKFSRHLDKTLEHCERALALDPGQVWSSLYKAHCLHDLGRWPEAATAYAAVDGGRFKRLQAWRGELAREQGAYCLWRSGEFDQARGLFEAILERREAAVARGQTKESAAVLHEPPIYMAEALVNGGFGPALVERLRAHLEGIGELWVLERVSD